VLPVIVPGCAGKAVTDTFFEPGALEPQVLSAVTETVTPLEPGIAVIDVDVELPLHPDGNDHVYEVAPETAEIL
jgi:hypothetical protein